MFQIIFKIHLKIKFGWLKFGEFMVIHQCFPPPKFLSIQYLRILSQLEGGHSAGNEGYFALLPRVHNIYRELAISYMF